MTPTTADLRRLLAEATAVLEANESPLEKWRPTRQKLIDISTAMCNALPGLLDRIEALEADVANWQRKESRRASCCLRHEDALRAIKAACEGSHSTGAIFAHDLAAQALTRSTGDE